MATVPDDLPVPKTEGEAVELYLKAMELADEIADEEEALDFIEAYTAKIPKEFQSVIGVNLMRLQPPEG